SPASRTAPLSFLFNLPAPTEIYTLSLHDALPIYRRVARRRRRETDWSAIHADSVWIAGAAREPDFHRASGHETERNASRAGGLGRIWPVEPGRPSGRLVGGGCLGYVRAGNPRCYRSGSKIHGRKNRVDFGAQRRERADRISGSGISCEERCLAPAAAEVLLASVASLARLLHPIFTAEFLECGGAFPDFAQAMVFHIFKREAGNHMCGVAGKRVAAWRNQH